MFNPFAAWNSILNWLTGGLYTLPGIANGPLWSLMWEEVAYAVLAILWILGAYKRPWIIWLLLMAGFLIVYLGQKFEPHTQIILFLIPSFFIGNLAYLHRNMLTKVPTPVPWLFLIAVIYNHKIPYFAQLVQLSPVGFQAFAVVWAGMAGTKIIPFRFPDISYGIYIFHMPIILYLVQKKLATTTSEIALALPIPLLAVSLLSWYLAEKPALKFKPGTRVANIAHYGNPIA